MTTARKTYAEQSAEYWRQAQEELEKDDLRQASEKGWGAASQMVKAVAEKRRWDHKSHHDLHDAVDKLADETKDSDLILQFGSAANLHINFYEGWLSRPAITLHLHQVNQLLAKLRNQL